MKRLPKFNLILLLLFAAGGPIISQAISSFLLRNARQEVLQALVPALAGGALLVHHRLP